MKNQNKSDSKDGGLKQNESQRLDKWLWYARAVKSRTLAQRLILAGKVRVNGVRVEAVHKPVRISDVLTISLDRDVLVWQILQFGMRRGPASQAQLLYKNLTSSQEHKSKKNQAGQLGVTQSPKPEKCPDKKDRRALRRAKINGI